MCCVQRFADSKKRRSDEKSKSFQEYEVSGLEALASAAALGENLVDTAESSAGATTKHPRHRPGCSCIVCIQPPSGKGRHKPTCTCNVCLTVKRRFKTLMLRKKKRQSEREAEAAQKDQVLSKDDSDTNETSRDDATQLVKEMLGLSTSQAEGGESSAAGQIDLNSDPNREDLNLDLFTWETDPTAVGEYMSQNGYNNNDLQNGESSLHTSQSNGEGQRNFSDLRSFASIIWNQEGRDEEDSEANQNQNNLC